MIWPAYNYAYATQIFIVVTCAKLWSDVIPNNQNKAITLFVSIDHDIVFHMGLWTYRDKNIRTDL